MLGLTAAEITDLARRVQDAGADAINIGVGWHESGVPTIAASVPRAAWTFAVKRIKDAVSVPVIASNRINTPETAEELLATGTADLISLARPFLADPDFAAKVKADRVKEICTCIACNQACLDAIFTDRAASCMVNPKAGREIEFLTPAPSVHQTVAVVGAGPAGLAYAVNAAERGHSVTLYDEAEVIGGQLNLARVVPGKFEFKEAIRYFQVTLEGLGIDVRLGHRATARELNDGGFDRVVLATGVRPRVPDIPGIDHPKVLSYRQVLKREAEPGPKVAIIGAGGIGFDVAEFLLGDEQESLDPETFLSAWNVDETGNTSGGLLDVRRRRYGLPPRHQITILQRKRERMGHSLGKSTGWILRARLANAGVLQIPGVTYDRIDDEGLHITVEGESRVLDVDSVVICAGQESERRLFDELQASGMPTVLIGGAHTAAELDAAVAIDHATREAFAL